MPFGIQREKNRCYGYDRTNWQMCTWFSHIHVTLSLSDMQITPNIISPLICKSCCTKYERVSFFVRSCTRAYSSTSPPPRNCFPLSWMFKHYSMDGNPFFTFITIPAIRFPPVLFMFLACNSGSDKKESSIFPSHYSSQVILHSNYKIGRSIFPEPYDMVEIGKCFPLFFSCRWSNVVTVFDE